VDGSRAERDANRPSCGSCGGRSPRARIDPAHMHASARRSRRHWRPVPGTSCSSKTTAGSASHRDACVLSTAGAWRRADLPPLAPRAGHGWQLEVFAAFRCATSSSSIARGRALPAGIVWYRRSPSADRRGTRSSCRARLISPPPITRADPAAGRRYRGADRPRPFHRRSTASRRATHSRREPPGLARGVGTGPGRQLRGGLRSPCRRGLQPRLDRQGSDRGRLRRRGVSLPRLRRRDARVGAVDTPPLPSARRPQGAGLARTGDPIDVHRRDGRPHDPAGLAAAHGARTPQSGADRDSQRTLPERVPARPARGDPRRGRRRHVGSAVGRRCPVQPVLARRNTQARRPTATGNRAGADLAR
jgi:hypothetical protein